MDCSTAVVQHLLTPEHDPRQWDSDTPHCKEVIMITNKGVIRPEHVALAAEMMAKAKTPSNATKFEVVIDGVGVAPKKVVSMAHYLATGDILSVSRFSGGVETNRFLKKRGVKVDLIAS